jgi:uncharacterized membrane protein YheB (UPF0754 family)
MKAKEKIVKEALLSSATDFGLVHRQNRRLKSINVDKMISEISEKENKLIETITERLKKHIIEGHDKLDLSEIDKKMDSYVHTLSTEEISKEDFYYGQVDLDIDNFIKGKKTQKSNKRKI